MCPVSCRLCVGGPRVLNYPYSEQSGDNGFASLPDGATDGAIKMFSRGQLPIKAAVADNFAVFNKFYAAVPSWSTPNHDFAQSATSCGLRDNRMWIFRGMMTPSESSESFKLPRFTAPFMTRSSIHFHRSRYSECGGGSEMYPQMTMYDSMFIDGVSFGFYMNATCGLKGQPACDSVGPEIDTVGTQKRSAVWLCFRDPF